jgi:hypothetical protein
MRQDEPPIPRSPLFLLLPNQPVWSFHSKPCRFYVRPTRLDPHAAFDLTMVLVLQIWPVSILFAHRSPPPPKPFPTHPLRCFPSTLSSSRWRSLLRCSLLRSPALRSRAPPPTLGSAPRPRSSSPTASTTARRRRSSPRTLSLSTTARRRTSVCIPNVCWCMR